jgi:hypothetical protein
MPAGWGHYLACESHQSVYVSFTSILFASIISIAKGWGHYLACEPHQSVYVSFTSILFASIISVAKGWGHYLACEPHQSVYVSFTSILFASIISVAKGWGHYLACEPHQSMYVSISMQRLHGYGRVFHNIDCDLQTVCTVSRAACTLQKGLGTVMHPPWCLERQHCRLVA